MSKLTESSALTLVVDGIDGHTDQIAGAENRKQGLLRGNRIKFDNTGKWIDQDTDEVIDSDDRFIITDLARVCVRWKDQKPEETIVLSPGEPVPDIAGWNNQTPQDQWVDGPSGRRGPWQFQQIVYVVNPTTMAVSSWPSSTVGGSIAIGKVVDAVKAMRKFKPGACPIVELSSVPMKTRFGTRPRPEFVIHGWVGTPGNDQGQAQAPAALPAPSTQAAAKEPAAEVVEVKSAKTANAKTAKPGKATGRKAAVQTLDSKSFVLGNTVAPPSLREELNDEIPHL
jgi:hypothetical protein